MSSLSKSDFIPIAGLLATGIVKIAVDLVPCGNIVANTATDVVNALAPNIASDLLGKVNYGGFREFLIKTHPSSLNQDLQRLIKDALVRSIGHIKVLYLEQKAINDQYSQWEKVLKRRFSDIEKTFTQIEKDLKGELEYQLKNGEKLTEEQQISFDLNEYLESGDTNTFDKIIDYLFEIQGIEEASSWAELKAFFAEQLPWIFDLSYKEALKDEKNIKAFKAYQMYLLEGIIKATNRKTDAVLEELKALKNGTQTDASKGLDDILDKQIEKLKTHLGTKFDGVYQKLDSVFDKLDVIDEKMDSIIEADSNSKNSSHHIPKKNKYPLPKGYIKRYCNKTEIETEDSFYKGLSREILFTEFLKKQKEPFRIILSSSAGKGKTIELDYISHCFSENLIKPNLYPVRYNLKDYKGEDLDKIVQTFYPEAKWVSENLVLILDGFDEIPETNKQSAIQSIRSYLDRKKNSVIISTRHNSYPEGLDKFEKVELLSLRDFQIKSILKEKLKNNDIENISKFRNEVWHKKIKALEGNPYELGCLIDIFNEEGELPDNKFQLFEIIIAKRLDDEKIKGRFINSILRKKHSQVIEKFALFLMLLDRMYLSELNVYDIFDQKMEDIKILKGSPFINYSETEISFDHNNFKEYFLGKHLQSLEFGTIKPLITFRDTERLKPSWKNGLSFLFSSNISENVANELIEFIEKSNYLALIGIERDRIQIKRRLEFFERIFYDRELLFAKRLSFEELINFLELNDSPDLLDVLIEKLSSENNHQIENALYFFKSLENCHGKEEKIKNHLKVLIENKDCSEKIHEFALEVLNDLNLFDKELVDFVLKTKPSFRNISVRDPIIRAINKLKLVDDYLNFYFATLRIKTDKGHNNNSYVYLQIFNGFEIVLNMKSVIRIINLRGKTYPDSRDDIFKGKKGFSKRFFNKLLLFEKSIKVRNAIVKSIYSHIIYDRNSFWVQEALDYLIKIHYQEKGFWRLWGKLDNNMWWIKQQIMCLATETTCQEMIRKFKFRDVDIKDIQDFHKLLPENFQELFRTEINEIIPAGNKIAKVKNHDEIVRKEKEQTLSLLMDKKIFFRKIKPLFNKKNQLKKRPNRYCF